MKNNYNRILSLTLAGILSFSGAFPVAASSVEQTVAEESSAIQQEIAADFLYSEPIEDNSLGVIIKLDTKESLESATLFSQTSQGLEETSASEIISNYAVFQLPSAEDRTFLNVESVIADSLCHTDLAPLEEGTILEEEDFQSGTETASTFSLDNDTSEEEAAVKESVITADLDETVSPEAIAASLEATVPSVTTQTLPSQDTEKKIIVLDPGHGGPGTGTYRDWGNGMIIDEAVINFKISNYTKEALEKNYANIEVYLTKTAQNENPAIKARVDYAVSRNADILVSQHINATNEAITQANGVLAMVPKLDSDHSFNEDAAKKSQELARSILDELVELEFKDMKFQFRLSSDSYYTDGSTADYYGIIRYCRINNLPGTIIEHGFANNQKDAQKLSNDNVLQEIGKADARGIAAYLKLNAGSSETPEDSGAANQPQKPETIKNSWNQENGKWYYYDQNGNKATGWQNIKNTWYYMDASGVMLTGWQFINNKWYYLNSSGAMLTGWQLINNKWYFMDSSGAMLTGWQLINNKWYFMDSSGAMLTGWQLINNKWYFMDSSGAMLTGWQLINNKWYFMNSSGAMLTGWQFINNKWYYLNSSGAMLTGWQLINNKWYFMDSSGAMASDTMVGSYYVDKSGAWVTNYSPAHWILSGQRWWYRHSDGSYTVSDWEKINGTWYLFDKDGWMLTGWQKVKGKTYYLEDSGAMLIGSHKIDGKTYTFSDDGSLIAS